MKNSLARFGIWRIFSYFVIYSFAGYVIETLFCLCNYGIFESRQSFLYGPFCSIYGLGAVVMIFVLKSKFSKNDKTLFVGGFIVGTIVEYFISLLGEIMLGVKWWDYSSRFLNINGRVCLLYSIFWAILGVVLVKMINPKVDKFLDFIKIRLDTKAWNYASLALFSFLMIDCMVSAFAIECFILRTVVENRLPVSNQASTMSTYNTIYKRNENVSDFIHKYWGNEKMVKTYPNLTVALKDGSLIYVRSLYPHIQHYYYKLEGRLPSLKDTTKIFYSSQDK